MVYRVTYTSYFLGNKRKKKIHAMDTLLDGIKYADLAYTIPAKSVDIAKEYLLTSIWNVINWTLRAKAV